MAVELLSCARSPAVDGIVLLDKPEGWTSHAAVQRVKYLFGARKAGHTGTLDPLATGLLVVCLGEATKFADYLLTSAKRYDAIVRLGVRTTTGDREGEALERRPVECTLEQIEEVLAAFRGQITQLPPMHSAVKLAGQPLYRYARKGLEVARVPRTVAIHELRLLQREGDLLRIVVNCGKGTYIRVLAEDIGQTLGCGASLDGLRRVAVGDLTLAEAATLPRLEGRELGQRREWLRSVDSMLTRLPKLSLDSPSAERIAQGGRITGFGPCGPGEVRLYDLQERFLGVGEVSEEAVLAPRRMMSRVSSPASSFSA